MARVREACIAATALVPRRRICRLHFSAHCQTWKRLAFTWRNLYSHAPGSAVCLERLCELPAHSFVPRDQGLGAKS